MSSTNKTTYYELSQFLADDKPAWLQDYNGDMNKIDSGVHAAQVAADNAQTSADAAQSSADSALSDVSTLETRVGTLENNVVTLTGDVNTVNALLGNGTPTTSDQTIIGAINSIEASIAPAEDGSVTTQAYQIGEQFMRAGTLYTALVAIASGTAFNSLTVGTDYTVSDTIAEQIGEVAENAKGYILKENVRITVTPASTDTFQDVIIALRDTLFNYMDALGTDYYALVDYISLAGFNYKPQHTTLRNHPDGVFTGTIISSQGVLSISDLTISSNDSSCEIQRVQFTSAGVHSFTDRTSEIYSSTYIPAVQFNLYKEIN